MILQMLLISRKVKLLNKVVDGVEVVVLVDDIVVDLIVVDGVLEVFSCCFPGVGIFWLVVVGARVGVGGVASVVDRVDVDVVEEASRG